MYQTTLSLLTKLKNAGFEAYLAGGCVRDLLLKHEPKDYDIVTNATPDQIEALFTKSRPVGKHFGVILVEENGHHFEIATFRSDSGYSDGRRPDFVTFTTAEEDAKRRDFTINGLFYDPISKEIKDYIGGQIDLKEKLIRFIGNPHDRIKEDHLRILRAIRFKNKLGFRFHPDTYEALKTHANLAGKVAAERVQHELNRMLLHSSRSKSLMDMYELGILQVILPEIAAMKGITQPFEYHTEGDVFEHTLMALHSIRSSKNLSLLWSTLLHDVGKAETFKLKERIRFDAHAEYSTKIARSILTRLRFPTKFIDTVCFLILHHMMWVSLRDMPTSRKKRWIFDKNFPNLLRLFKADASGSRPLNLSLYNDIKKIINSVKKEIKKLPKPFVNGNDLQKHFDLKPGPIIGTMLTSLHDAQLEHKVTSKKEALALAKKLLKNI